MAGVSVATRETAVAFGEGGSLVGIWSEPTVGAPAARPAVFVMVNAGIIHRVGPNRLHVSLARWLAAAGISSLRFDMSGIGDSRSPSNGLSSLDCALRDIGEALDWVQGNRGTGDVILMGLCSGADLAVIRAAADPRVKGIVLLDPNIPRTPKFRVNDYRRRLMRLVSKAPTEMVSSLATLMRRRLSVESPGGVAARPSDEEVSDFLVGYYGACARSALPMLAIFTGGRLDYCNYREQILDAFPGVDFSTTLTLEYLPESDHTFSLEVHRAHLRESIDRWLLGIAAGPSRSQNLDATLP